MGQHKSKIHQDEEIRKVYSFHDVLGRGSLATVRRGRRINPGPKDKEVAIKVVKTAVLSDEEKQALEEEIKILFELDHPNIVQLHEVFIATKRKVYMVMELLEGGEMFNRIVEQDHFSEAIAAFALVQILDALVYCHSKGICHRDLKPENIFYSSKEKKSKLVVGDFGIASSGRKLMSTCCGSPQYMAPEVIKKGFYNMKVDCWSVGVILYILLSGYPPFFAESQPKIYNLILNEPYNFDPSYWAHISDDAKDLISKLLTKNPRKRISAREAKGHRWMARAVGYDKSLGVEYQKRIQRFRAVQKLRAGVTTMLAVCRMVRIMNALIEEK